VDGSERVDGLQFENNLLRHQHVEPISTIKLHPFIYNRDGLLSLECDAAPSEFVTETFFVGVLEKTGAEEFMDLDGGADDFVGYFVIGHAA
jgi:hypothetical protein